MIYGNVKEIYRYMGISKWFDSAIDFLMNTNLATLELGKQSICGDHVFINVMNANTVDEHDSDFEIHKKYWDIQIDIEGKEIIQVGMDCKGAKQEYNEEIDFGTVICSEYESLVLGEGRFIVCMNGEPHKPTLIYDESRMIKKCVIKVEGDQ